MFKIENHPVWLVGFRPFFIFAFLAGAFLPILWILGFTGLLDLSGSGLSSVQWHAHEMFFGFGWAVLGGFLLTASKNWLKIRGLHGKLLMLAVLLWIAERFLIFNGWAREWPLWLQVPAQNASVVFIGTYVSYCLLRYRKQDTFPDNYFFLLALPLFVFSKQLLLMPEHYFAGWTMTLGLFRLAFAVMFERTIPQFMKNSQDVILLRNPWLDLLTKFLVLLSIFVSFLPSILAVVVVSLAATLLLVRFFLWHPIKGFQKFEIGIMYVGYFALAIHLYFEAFRIYGTYTTIGSLSVHVFSFLCMGIVISGMLIRISQGHTGRPLVFTKSDRLAFGCMFIAAFARLVLTQFAPSHYTVWITISGIGWFLCFTLIGIRLTPFLLKTRTDGKVH